MDPVFIYFMMLFWNRPKFLRKMGTEADFSLATVIKITKNTLGKVKNKPKVKIKQTKIT